MPIYVILLYCTMEIQETIRNFIPKSIDWHKYNLAKTQEKRWFYRLLQELSLIIPEEPYKFGRPAVSIRDLFFAAGLKLYSNCSGRKIAWDIIHAAGAGYIRKSFHFNRILEFLNCGATYDLLQKMLTISAIPLGYLEENFAIDSSGFGSYKYNHVEHKSKPFTIYSMAEGKKRNFIKGHIAIGTRTHIICACEITHRFVSDVSRGEEIIKRLGQNFEIKELVADKAYCTKRIHQLVESLGAIPYIPFRHNINPKKNSPEIWIRMHEYFLTNQDRFKQHYHRRSNVESVFSMIKMRLGEFLRCKNEVAQQNELMVKFICHNICCLIAEMFENEAHIDFRKAVEKTIKSQGKEV